MSSWCTCSELTASSGYSKQLCKRASKVLTKASSLKILLSHGECLCQMSYWLVVIRALLNVSIKRSMLGLQQALEQTTVPGAYTKQLSLLQYRPTFQDVLGSKHLQLHGVLCFMAIQHISVEHVTQCSISDWMEATWCIQFKFRSSSNPAHNPVQWLDRPSAYYIYSNETSQLEEEVANFIVLICPPIRQTLRPQRC